MTSIYILVRSLTSHPEVLGHHLITEYLTVPGKNTVTLLIASTGLNKEL